MKMSEEIKGFKKEYVYDKYTRIVNNFKDYDKITKVKMLDAIYNVYNDYNNIIDICTASNNWFTYLDVKEALIELIEVGFIFENKIEIDPVSSSNSTNLCPFLVDLISLTIKIRFNVV